MLLLPYPEELRDSVFLISTHGRKVESLCTLRKLSECDEQQNNKLDSFVSLEDMVKISVVYAYTRNEGMVSQSLEQELDEETLHSLFNSASDLQINNKPISAR